MANDTPGSERRTQIEIVGLPYCTSVDKEFLPKTADGYVSYCQVRTKNANSLPRDATQSAVMLSYNYCLSLSVCL